MCSEKYIDFVSDDCGFMWDIGDATVGGDEDDDEGWNDIFSVAKATLQPPLSTKDVVILKQGCGYIQKDVVI